MKKYILLILSAISIVLLVLIYFKNEEIKKLKIENKQQNMLIKLYSREKENKIINFDKYSSSDISVQKDLIISDLISNQDIILKENEGILGGQKGFYDKDNIYILNKQWVVAYFEDGHNYSYMLLKYEFINSEKIKWTILDIQN